MKLSYTEEVSYLLKASLIEARNRRIVKCQELARDGVNYYQQCSRLHWEIDQLNKMIDKCDKNLATLFIP